MITKPVPLLRPVLATVLLFLCAGIAGHAEAQVIRSLKDAMFGKHAEDGRASRPPVTAHFVSEDGEKFVLDESQSHPLLRFDGDDETYVLTATPGLKGDVIFKNDMGQPILKATRLGGMILFSDDRPMGDPAAPTGKAEAFEPAHLTPGQLWQTFARASHRVSLLLERNLGFEADDDITPDDASLYANAATATSNAIADVAGMTQGTRLLENVREVHFADGRPPSAQLNKGVLMVKLDASRGPWGGHVSSKRIVHIIQTSFTVQDDADRR